MSTICVYITYENIYFEPMVISYTRCALTIQPDQHEHRSTDQSASGPNPNPDPIYRQSLLGFHTATKDHACHQGFAPHHSSTNHREEGNRTAQVLSTPGPRTPPGFCAPSPVDGPLRGGQPHRPGCPGSAVVSILHTARVQCPINHRRVLSSLDLPDRPSSSPRLSQT
jgi:hypothetical protein